MRTSRCTLRNVAERCGVSTAVVSAVLNGREGSIACSARTREKIRTAARELNYVPNVLARSIRKQRVPRVGVFIRKDPGARIMNRSMVNILSASAEVLNRHGYETIFVPFQDAASQLARMESLVSMGIIGGVVTAVIPGDSAGVCDLLKGAGLPYLILGNPPVPDVYCFYGFEYILRDRCLEFASRRGLTRCVSVQPSHLSGRKYLFRAMPFPGDYIWNAPLISEEEVVRNAGTTLFVVMGIRLFRNLTAGRFPCEHAVVVGFDDEKDSVPPELNTVFLDTVSVNLQGLEAFFIPWLLDGKVPEKYHNALPVGEESFDFNFHF
ncbi:MAG: LacI family DNA-binding transcriptional regulator [Lentisphaeria bacterium]|nr:LacI family DNA-binding transcriptional regulator [Lentisphaeria bacterium]